MATLTNTTPRDITLATMHLLPRAVAGKVTAVPMGNDTIRCPDNWPMLQAKIMLGDVIAEFDPEPGDEPAKPAKPAKG